VSKIVKKSIQEGTNSLVVGYPPCYFDTGAQRHRVAVILNQYYTFTTIDIGLMFLLGNIVWVVRSKKKKKL